MRAIARTARTSSVVVMATGYKFEVRTVRDRATPGGSRASYAFRYLMDDAILLNELSPVAERLMNRHLNAAKDWLPHEYVPWSRGRDFEPGEQWGETPATP